MALPYVEAEMMSSKHRGCGFFNSKAKNAQATEAAQAVKPPGLKGLWNACQTFFFLFISCPPLGFLKCILDLYGSPCAGFECCSHRGSDECVAVDDGAEGPEGHCGAAGAGTSPCRNAGENGLRDCDFWWQSDIQCDVEQLRCSADYHHHHGHRGGWGGFWQGEVMIMMGSGPQGVQVHEGEVVTELWFVPHKLWNGWC